MTRTRGVTRASGAPARWAVVVVGSAARAIPRGDVRDRYAQELIAELYGMGRTRQAAFTWGVLTRIWALRVAVAHEVRPTEEQAMRIEVRRKPPLCAMNVHHVWRIARTEDGGRYRRCMRCGKDDSSSGGASWGGSWGGM